MEHFEARGPRSWSERLTHETTGAGSASVARMRWIRPWRVLPILLVVAVVATGCGGDDGGSVATLPDDAEPGTVDDEPTAPEDGEADPAGDDGAADDDGGGLFGDDGDDEIIDPPPLAGTRWSATDYNMATGGMTNVLPGTEVTLDFADGTLSGTTGCRSFTASWTVEGPYNEFNEGIRDEADGQAISMTLTEVTEEECAEGFVSEQNDDILATIEGVDRWLIARGGLILRGGDHYLEAYPA